MESEVMNKTNEGGGAEGAWLRLNYENLRGLVDSADDFVPVITAIVRWYCGLEYEILKGAKGALFDSMRATQLRNVSGWKKKTECGRAGGVKSGAVRRMLRCEGKGLASSSEAPKPNTELRPKPDTEFQLKPNTEPKSASSVSESRNDVQSVTGSAFENFSVDSMFGAQSTMYDRLKDDLISGILEVIGKPKDTTERRAWKCIADKILKAGHTKDDIAETVYAWYRAIDVDGEPNNRAAALNSHIKKQYEFTS